jgi:hypothetical protein
MLWGAIRHCVPKPVPGALAKLMSLPGEMTMHKRNFSPDQQLLGKIEGRFVAIRMSANAHKTARTSKEPMEMDGPSLPFLYQG